MQNRSTREWTPWVVARPAIARAAIAGLGVVLGVVVAARWFTRFVSAGG